MKKTALILLVVLLLSNLVGFTSFAEGETLTPGKRTDPFAIAATGVTTLSPLYFNDGNPVDGDYLDWTKNYGMVTGAGKRYFTYDLDVEVAGAYRITATMSTYDADAEIGIYRQGDGVRKDTRDVCGDIVVSTAKVHTSAWNDTVDVVLGTVSFKEGINRISFKNVSGTYHTWNYKFEKVGDFAVETHKVSCRDARVVYTGATGTSLMQTLYTDYDPAIVPNLTMQGDHYYLFDLPITGTGLYEVVVYEGGGNGKYTLTMNPTIAEDQTVTNNGTVLFDAVDVYANDGYVKGKSNLTACTPKKLGVVPIEAGNHTFKLSMTGGGRFFAYFTIKKVADLSADDLTKNISYICSTGKTTIKAQSAYLSNTYINPDFGYGAWRDYKINVEETGIYKLVVNVFSGYSELGFQIEEDSNILFMDYVEIPELKVYKDVTVGEIKLNAGEHDLRIMSLEASNQGYIFPHFTLEKVYDNTNEAEDCNNLATDAVESRIGNGGNVVRLTAGQKMEYSVSDIESGLYNVTAYAACDNTDRTFTLSQGINSAISNVSGSIYAPYQKINLGDIYLNKGTDVLKIELTSGNNIDIDYIILQSPTISIMTSGYEVDKVVNGTMTANGYLNGTFVGKSELMYAFAIYKDNKLEYIDVKTSNEIDINSEFVLTINDIKKESGSTYKAKVFVWDNLNGVCKSY